MTTRRQLLGSSSPRALSYEGKAGGGSGAPPRLLWAAPWVLCVLLGCRPRATAEVTQAPSGTAPQATALRSEDASSAWAAESATATRELPATDASLDETATAPERGDGDELHAADASLDERATSSQNDAADAGLSDASTDSVQPPLPSRCRVYSYERGLSRGRELSSKKRFGAASEAFDEAVRARPYDARARVERAYARILDGKSPIDELELARALTRDRALLAQIAYNEGLAFDARGNHEAARWAWVRAERLGAMSAGEKLGAASRCTVSEEGGTPLKLYGSFREVFEELQRQTTCRPMRVDSEAEAKRYACGRCPGYDKIWVRGSCKGDGPWELQTGYLHCSVFRARIQKFGKDQFTVVQETSDPPMERSGPLWVQVSLDRYSSGVYGHFEKRSDDSYRVGEGWTDEISEGDPACIEDERRDAELESMNGCQSSLGAVNITGETHRFFTEEGQFVGGLRLAAEDVSKVHIDVESAVIRVTGNGCDLSIRWNGRDAGGAPSPSKTP